MTAASNEDAAIAEILWGQNAALAAAVVRMMGGRPVYNGPVVGMLGVLPDDRRPLVGVYEDTGRDQRPTVGVTSFHDGPEFRPSSSEQPETDGLATWYEVSTDAPDGYGSPSWPSWRCQVPARHLPGVLVRAGAPFEAQRGAVAVLQVPHPAREAYLREAGVRVVCDVDDSEWHGKRQQLKLQTVGSFKGGRAAAAARGEEDRAATDQGASRLRRGDCPVGCARPPDGALQRQRAGCPQRRRPGRLARP
jgi:hypothetical protein